MATLDLKSEGKPYQPIGAALDLWKSRDPEIIICGPVGTGKTRAGCEKIHYACDNFKGCRVLLLRQTRHSLSSTVLVTLEDHVIPDGHLAKAGARRESRSTYKYPNGSEIVLGGMDEPDKFMSGEYDIIYIVEITDCREAAVEQVSTRLRNGVLPFQQLMGDCNPRNKRHWVKQRCDRGTARLLNSRLQDNPRFYLNGAFTEEGEAYLERLGASLNNKVRRERLLHGLWADPEGARFGTEEFPVGRTIQGFTMYELFPGGFPQNWPKWQSGDYGRADPYCALWHTKSPPTQEFPDGVTYTYKEDYMRGLGADQQAERIVSLSPQNERYEGIWLDRSMWSKEESFGAIHKPQGGQIVKTPAAEQYAQTFREANEALGEYIFGPPVPGARNIQEEGYETLDSLLRKGGWLIEHGCTNLWDEIEDAVYYQDPKTLLWSELINPIPGKKFCADHALEASVYGIHKRTPHAVIPDDDTIDLHEVRIKELQDARKRASDYYARKSGRARPSYL